MRGAIALGALLAVVGAMVTPQGAAAALLPSTTVKVDVKQVAGVTDVQGGVKQTATATGQVVEAVQALGATLTGTAPPDVTEQVAALQATAQDILADIQALDPTAAQADLQAAIGAIESQVLSLGLSTGLTSGLSIAQNVLSPVCSLLAIPTSFAPGLGLDLTRTYKLASPQIEQIDQKTDQLIKQVYDTVYAQILAILGANATTATVPALLQLLQFTWTTTYEAPDGTRVVKTAPGLINLPTPIDVDNSGTFDICAMAGYALDASGAVIMKQTITKMPLSKAKLPLRVDAPMLLGLLNVGYDTTTQAGYDTDPSATVDNSQSTAPVSYAATTTYSSALTRFDTAVAVHRGYTLTLPPVDFNPLPDLPTVPPLTEKAPTPKLTQNLCLLSCGTLLLSNRYDNEANALHVATPAPSATNHNLTYSASAIGDLYKLTYSLLNGLSNAVSKATPAPRSLAYCHSVSATAGVGGKCSNAPHKATDRGSLNLLSSTPIHFDNFTALGAAQNTTCAARSADVHVDGTRLTMSNTPPATDGTGGKSWIDTANELVNGCVGFASSSTGIQAATFPVGFKANGRDAAYHTVSGVPVPDTKTGTVTCPATTDFKLGSSAQLTPVVCPVLPVITAGPTVSGEPVADAPLTASSTWAPAANSPAVPNSPTLTYQWLRCDGSGNGCSPVAGATDPIYLTSYGDGPSGPNTDIGHTFKVKITGTNIDGSANGTSPATAVVADQTQAPGIVNLPTITGVAGTGHTLTAHSSLADWSHGVSQPLQYQWQKCNPACGDIAGATGTTYDVVYPDDLASTIQVVVTATNHFGPTAATSAAVTILPKPTNSVVGTIQRCTNTACTVSADIPSGSAPFTGDKLKVTDGSWANALTLAYQWIRCDDTLGTNCTPIAGATTNRYTVSKANDLGKTLKVAITGSNNNLDALNGNPAVTMVETLLTAVVTPAKPAVQPGPAADGIVNVVTASGHDTTYLGGAFDTVGPAVGGAGAEVLASGSSQGSVVNGAQVTGGTATIKAIISDTAGGYFIGGDFTKVQGLSCPSFAHITSTGVVNPAYCSLGINGEVRALSLTTGSYGKLDTTDSPNLGYRSTTRIAIGGLFTAGSRANLVYVDPSQAVKTATGDPQGDPNGAVNAFAPAGATATSILASPPAAVTQAGRLYIGGDFTKFGTTNANHIIRYNWGTTSAGGLSDRNSVAGATYTYDNTFVVGVCTGAPSSGLCPGASVKSLLLSTGALLAGGSFDGAFKAADAPSARANAAAFSLTSPFGLTNWTPNPNGVVNTIAAGTAPTSTVPGSVFIGGQFTHIGAASPAGQDVQNVGAYGITSAGAASTAAATQLNGAPSSLFTPTVDGVVNAISAGATSSTSYIVIGGAFTKVMGQERNRIAGFVNQGAAGNAPLALQPLTMHAGNTVYALSRDASTRLLAGGAFKVLGGAVRKNVAEISASSGVTSFRADTDGPVSAIGANDTNVYLAGAFTKVSGTSRDRLAAVQQSDASLIGWTPSLTGTVNVLTADNSAVYAGGAFSNIGGLSRSSLAALDPATGSATSWNSGGVTGGAATVKAIVLSGGKVLVGGNFGHTGGADRNNVAALDSSGAATGWDPNADGPVNAIFVDPDDDTGIFLGGAFGNVGGAARANVAKVNDTTGAASGWQADTNGAVTGLVVFSNNLYLTGAFTSTGGQANGILSGVDATTAEVLDWQPTPSGVIRSMAVTKGGLIAIGGDFVTFNPPITGTNATPVFSYKPGFALLG